MQVLDWDYMPKPNDLTDAAKNATIERSVFDAALKKILEAKRPITKAEISQQIKNRKRGLALHPRDLSQR